MILNLLKSKIHCATVTEANLQYMGSITIDEALMEAAHILPNERVQVVDNNNGARLETYVIPGPKNSGVICLNGAAALRPARRRGHHHGLRLYDRGRSPVLRADCRHGRRAECRPRSALRRTSRPDPLGQAHCFT